MLLQNVLVHEQVHFEMGAQRVLLKGLNAWMQNIEKSPSRASRKQAWLSRKFPGVHGIDPHCTALFDAEGTETARNPNASGVHA